MVCPEKGAPERLYGACGLKDLAGHGRVSEKDFLSGRKRAAAKPRPGPRTALSMRVSTADQKPDLQDDDLRGYAARAGLDVVQDDCDVAVSGRREGRPQLNALMAAARNHEIDCVLVWTFDRFARSTRHLLTALEEFDTSACDLSASRIRSTPIARWAGRCSPSSARWPNWSPRSSASA